jgi:hypothetical protein
VGGPLNVLRRKWHERQQPGHAALQACTRCTGPTTAGTKLSLLQVNNNPHLWRRTVSNIAQMAARGWWIEAMTVWPPLCAMHCM